VTADTNGTAVIRGFRGTYQLTVRAGQQTKTLEAELPQAGQQLTIVLE